MKCSKCKQLLVEFSEERLESGLNQEIREHISDCGACRQELNDFQSSLSLMEDTRNLERVPDPPGDFVEQVMNRVRQNDGGHHPFRRLAFGFAIVCCLLGLGTALLFHEGTPKKQYTPPVSDGTAAVETEIPESMRSVDYVKQKLVRMLDQTLEIIEEGEQEWEIEI